MSDTTQKKRLPLHWKMAIGFLAGLAIGLVAHSLGGADLPWVKWLTITSPSRSGRCSCA